METEYKYRLDNESIFDDIVNDNDIITQDDKTIENINMRANYFDTDDFDFRKKGIAYRIRHENDRITATIKWDKDVKDGLHIREEFNLVVTDDRFAENPDIEIFKSSDAYDVLYQASHDKKLKKKIGMEFLRRQIKVDTGKSISCLSVDNGVIHHQDGHNIPVLELEIEWYYGDEQDFKDLAGKIQSKYNLVVENISKLQQAFL